MYVYIIDLGDERVREVGGVTVDKPHPVQCGPCVIVVSRCRGIGPPFGIPSSGLFLLAADYVVIQRPPARFPVSYVRVGVACPARGFCHSPRRFLCVFLQVDILYIFLRMYLYIYRKRASET